MATPAIVHSSSTKSLVKELKPRVEKAEKAASELQIGDVYIKDKLKMASETLTRMDKSKSMWSDLLRCFTKMHDGMAVMTEASSCANHVILQLSKLYRGDLGDTLRDIARYRNEIVEQYSKLAESLYDQFLVVVAKSIEPAAKEIDEKKVFIRKKTKEIEKQMATFEKNMFKVKKQANQAQLQEAMRKYNEVKSALDVERAQVLEGVLLMERNRFKFLIDAYSNVVKNEIVLGETLSNQWKGLASWEEGEQAEALVTSREQSYKPVKTSQAKESPQLSRVGEKVADKPVASSQPKIQITTKLTESPPKDIETPKLSGLEVPREPNEQKGSSPRESGAGHRSKIKDGQTRSVSTSRPADSPRRPSSKKSHTNTINSQDHSPPPPSKTKEVKDTKEPKEIRDSSPVSKVRDFKEPKEIRERDPSPVSKPKEFKISPREPPKEVRERDPSPSKTREAFALPEIKKPEYTFQEVRQPDPDFDEYDDSGDGPEDLDFGITTNELKSIDLSKYSIPAFNEAIDRSSNTSEDEDVSFDIDTPRGPRFEDPTAEELRYAASLGDVAIRRSLQIKSIDPASFSRPPEFLTKEAKKGFRQSIAAPIKVDYSEGQALWREIDADMKYIGSEVEGELKSLQTLRGQEYLTKVHAILDGENLQKALGLVEEYEDLCDHFPEVFCLRENLLKKDKFKHSLQEIKDKLNAFIVQEITRASTRK